MIRNYYIICMNYFNYLQNTILAIGNQYKMAATAVGNEKLRPKQNYRNWGTRYFSEKIIHLFSSFRQPKPTMLHISYPS